MAAEQVKEMIAAGSRSGTLIVTQRLDPFDPALGFFVSWIDGLAASGHPLWVACWSAAQELSLPANVRVIVLPTGRLRRTWELIRLSWELRRQVRSVFVHMIPPVVVALGWWWRCLGWRVVLWYTHGSVPWSLRVAKAFVDQILTASPESCRLATSKKQIVGHGIDVAVFAPSDEPRQPLLIAVGRLTRRKNALAFLALCQTIRKLDPALVFRAALIGEPATVEDQAYVTAIKQDISDKQLAGIVTLTGGLTGQSLRRYYRQAALLVSPSLTGSLDKVVLEALASETPVMALGAEYASWPVMPWSTAEPGMIRAAEQAINCLRRPQARPAGRIAVMERANFTTLIQRIATSLWPDGAPFSR